MGTVRRVVWQNLDFDKFGPQLLKTCIVRIARGSHTEGFLESGHILSSVRNLDRCVVRRAALCSTSVVYYAHIVAVATRKKCFETFVNWLWKQESSGLPKGAGKKAHNHRNSQRNQAEEMWKRIYKMQIVSFCTWRSPKGETCFTINFTEVKG